MQVDPRLAAVVAELDRRRRRERFLGEALLSPKQIVARSDRALFQAWPAGRQSGKTDLGEREIIKRPFLCAGTQSFYVTTSIKRAVATIWEEVVRFNRDHELGGTPNHSLHYLAFPNDSRAWVTGCENKAMADDLRGRKKPILYFIDECQDWKDDLLRYFFEQVVYPSLVAVKGAAVIMAGTGGKPRGFWYEVSRGANDFSVHVWTPFDNIFLPEGARALVDNACRNRGVDESDPSIQREFYARFVADLTRQIFPYDRAKNGYTPDQLPKGSWRYVVSADVGSVDATSVGALGWCDSDPRLWLLKHNEIWDSGVTAQLALYRSYLGEFANGLAGAVADPGGGGASLIVDLGKGPNGIQVEAAEKTGKAAACLLMRDALRTGMLMVPADDETLIRDLTEPEWDPDNIGAAIRGHMPDSIDMLLYGFRKARALNWYRPPEVVRIPTAAEHMAKRWEEFDQRGEREEDPERW